MKNEVRATLEEVILKKLESIKNKTLNAVNEDPKADLQTLIMVSEELDDVLLNWESDAIPLVYGSPDIDFDDDDFDDDDE